MSRYVRQKQAGGWIDPLKRIPREQWPDTLPRGHHWPAEVWKSAWFLLQVYDFEGVTRLTVNRVQRTGDDWRDNITWEDLQELKHQCGRGDCWAVECYPPDGDVVDDANMRHLFILEEPPLYGWRKHAD